MLIVCLISLCAAKLAFAQPLEDDRIVGGQPISILEAPHQISLMANGIHTCGGSIIAKEWVVTAAHCTAEHPNPSRYQVRAGSTTKLGGTLHSVDKIFVRNGLGTCQRCGDVALIHLVDPFKFDDYHQPVVMFNAGEEATPGQNATITGWGSANPWFKTESLHAVTIPIVSKQKCQECYASFGPIPEDQICAGLLEGGKDSCQGDSGGPLTIDNRLAGIVSWGIGCARPKFPGVYTEVAYHRDWIKAVTGV